MSSSSVRLTINSSGATALEVYEALKARGQVKQSVVIALLTDGNYHVLAQEMNGLEAAKALWFAAQAVNDLAAITPTPEPIAAPRHQSPLAINTLAAQWASLEGMVFSDTPRAHRVMMRRVFYCGAQSFMHALSAELDSDEDLNDDNVGRLNGLVAELNHFHEELAAGRA